MQTLKSLSQTPLEAIPESMENHARDAVGGWLHELRGHLPAKMQKVAIQLARAEKAVHNAPLPIRSKASYSYVYDNVAVELRSAEINTLSERFRNDMFSPIETPLVLKLRLRELENIEKRLVWWDYVRVRLPTGENISASYCLRGKDTFTTNLYEKLAPGKREDLRVVFAIRRNILPALFLFPDGSNIATGFRPVDPASEAPPPPSDDELKDIDLLPHG